MSDVADTEYEFEDDVSLDLDEKNVGGSQQEWLKFTKGQIVRGAFVYFYTYDANAVKAATKAARDSGRKLAREEQVTIAKEALTKRADELKKTIDQLTAVDRLDVSSAHFKLIKAHYEQGMGFLVSRLGKDGPEGDAVWKRLSDPKTYLTTLLLLYPTNPDGAVNVELFAAQARARQFRLIPWRFGSTVYNDIYSLESGLKDNKLTLASQDIKIECKEPQYQKVSIGFAGAAIWQKNESLKNAVLTAALPFYEKLNPFRNMSTEALREKLGISTPGAISDVSSDDYKDLLNSV